MKIGRLMPVFVFAAVGAMLAACAETQLIVHTAKGIKSEIGTSAKPPTPMLEGPYKLGGPYEVNGAWYFPEVDAKYDETGIASWYGSEFHGRPTANGEIFDMNEVTAAHKTLPMPSWVTVTNLENGRVILVRVNDRGPFVGRRIIDVSRRAAQLLGFYRKGTAKVRVQFISGKSPEPTTLAARDEPAAEEPQLRTAVAYKPTVVTVEPLGPPARVETAPLAVRAPGEGMPDDPSPEVTKRDRGMFVQVGTFAQPDNATRLRARLVSFGTALVSPITVNGRTLYRVRVGPIDDPEDADATLSRVIKSGHPDARLIID